MPLLTTASTPRASADKDTIGPLGLSQRTFEETGMDPALLPLTVYVAGPFRAYNAKGEIDHWAVEQNIRTAEGLALEVWRLRSRDDQPLAAALCPHTNTRFYQGAAPDDVWLNGDLALLYGCDAVLMVPNWRQSSGARAEHAFALAHDIPVFYTLDSLREWLEDVKPRRLEGVAS